ncbi:hypothetical protein LC609_29975 [Nostoc sp. XA013]|nr:hypothetical protein [Nostoc sp. XA013]
MSFSGKKLLISLKLLLQVLVCSFFISLLFALIHVVLTINITNAIFGLTLLISSIIAYFWNQNIAKNKYRLEPNKQLEVIANNQKVVEKTVETTVNTTVHRTVNTNASSNIDTGGGNYNKEIRGNYIQRDSIGRDSVTKNIKNITVGNREVEINPNYIVDTFDEFRDILTQSITQSSNALEAISEFAKELTEELRKHPEVKVCFGVDENISVEELLNKIFIDLVNKNYEQSNESYPITRITYDQIKKINNFSNLAYIEQFESNGNGEYDLLYRGYTVHLFLEQSKWWLYRIRRSNSSIFEHSNTRRSRNIYFAIGRAIDQIEKEIEINWKNSMSNPE